MNEIELKYDINTLNQAVEYNKSSGRFMIVPMHSGDNDLDTLEKAWEKFNSQHKQLRRESDWKSLELFGITNQEHYEYLKSKCLNYNKIELPKPTDIIIPSNTTVNTNLFEFANIKSKDVGNINESKNSSKLDSNFKKKSGKTFTYIDIYDPRAKKYLTHENGYFTPDEYKERQRVGEIVIDSKTKEFVGYIIIKKGGTIAPLLVKEEYRGYGVGEILFKDAVNKYKGTELGVYSDNEVAIKIYKKYGFKEDRIKTYKDGEKVIIMKLDKKSPKLEMSSFDYGCLLSENASGVKKDIIKLNLSLYKPKGFSESVKKENLLTIDDKESGDGTIDNKIKVDYPALPPDELLDLGVFSNDNYYAEYKALKIDDKHTTKDWFESYQKYCLGIVEQEFISITQSRHSKLIGLCHRLSKDPDNDQLKQHILELGWNPELPYTSENRNLMSKYTKTKLNEFYNEFSFIDIQGIEDIDYINEEMSEENILYPVYIVLLSSKTAFGKVIKRVTDSIWTHGAVSFDTKMDKIYSYDREGFTYDSLEKYGKDSKISVYTIFLNKKDYIKIKTRLDYFIANKKKTHYGFGNLLNTITGKVRVHDLNLICTEFVDKLFKFIGIDITHKSSNLVTPEDVNKSVKNNKKIYKVYEGMTGNYKKSKVDQRINKLKLSGKVFRELFTDKLCESIIDKYTIESIVETKEFPVQFDKDGNLLIKNIKRINYNAEYNKSHKLLKEYEKTGNIDGMKYEISKLWFMYHLLEKIKHEKNLTREELKTVNDSRARIYNDFQKYLNIIQSKEKDFNFNRYYEESPFSDSAYKFNASTLKFTKDFIKSLIF